MLGRTLGQDVVDPNEPGLLGGIFSRQGYASIHVKFSDVDWATLVRSGDFISTEEVRSSEGVGHGTKRSAAPLSTVMKYMLSTT